MGTVVVSGPKAQKAVVSGPKAQKLLQAAQDLFDGLQSTWFQHMVSRQPKKNFMVSKKQKKCVCAEMYQNDGLPWIYPTVIPIIRHQCSLLPRRIASCEWSLITAC
jgi:hypothetical protein